MFKKFVLHLWAARLEFVKYFIIGVSGVVLDIGSLYLFKEKFGFTPTFSVVINQLILINYSFFLNKYWAFKSKGVTHQQMVRFYILAGINYALSIGWMAFFNGHLHFNYLLVRTSNIALAVAWNFLLYKNWVYRSEELLISNS